FLLLLAIADDALGLAVLAMFYPAGDLHVTLGVLLMAAALVAAFGVRRMRAMSFWPYVVPGGALSWLALFLGGLHPALAPLPLLPFIPHAPRDPGLFVEAPPEARDPLIELEHSFNSPAPVSLVS